MRPPPFSHMAIGEIPVAILLAEKIVRVEARISSALRRLAVTAVAVAAQGRVLRAHESWSFELWEDGKDGRWQWRKRGLALALYLTKDPFPRDTPICSPLFARPSFELQ